MEHQLLIDTSVSLSNGSVRITMECICGGTMEIEGKALDIVIPVARFRVDHS